MRPGDAAVHLAGERAVLLPERGVWLPARDTLLAADLHWGKAAAFRAASIPVPSGTTTETLERLSRAMARTGASRLVLLGDLLHDRAGRAPRTLDVVRRFRDRHAGVQVVLVRGNHDARAGDPPDDLGIECVTGPLHEPPFAFRHEPVPTRGRHTLAGHLHPAVVLVGSGRQRQRLPCFLLGRRVTVLPAFGAFTGSARVEPGARDRVFVIAGEQVTEAGR